MRANVAIVTIVLLSTACAQRAGADKKNAAEPLTVAATEAYQRWKAAPEKVVILDVRTPSEYKSGHIRGAQNVDFYTGFERAIQQLPKDKVYYLHCASGRRSASAVEIMRKYGFHAYNIGGYDAVVQAGFPTE